MVTRRIGLGLGLVLALGGSVACKKEEASSDDGATSPSSGKVKKGPPPRLRTVKLDEIGDRPGYLADGMIFAAVEAGVAQDFLRQMPLPGYMTRDLAEARRELGFDLLSDDVLERFAIPKDAVISMTLGRPVGLQHLEPVRTAIRGDDHFLRTVARVISEQEGNRFETYLKEPLPPEPPVEWVEPLPPELPVEELPVEELGKPMAFSPPEVEIIEPEIPEEIPGGVPGGVPGVCRAGWSEACWACPTTPGRRR